MRIRWGGFGRSETCVGGRHNYALTKKNLADLLELRAVRVHVREDPGNATDVVRPEDTPSQHAQDAQAVPCALLFAVTPEYTKPGQKDIFGVTCKFQIHKVKKVANRVSDSQI